MIRPINPSGFRSASSRSAEGRAGGTRNRGYALLIVMMMATLFLISLTVALPNVYRAGLREREEELIFRGNEYARGIMLFQRQFRRYPTSIKELVEKTNGIRFLRREYRDPMSRKGKWRFIYADANGVVLNSKTIAPPKKPKPLGGMGTTETTAKEEETKQQGSEEESAPSSSFFSNEVKGGFIVGVASSSRKRSIRVYNGKTRYDEWEFLGLPGNAALGGVPAVGGQPPAAGQQSSPGQPGQQRPGMPGLQPPRDVPLTDQ